jgi:hypothetical protein
MSMLITDSSVADTMGEVRAQATIAAASLEMFMEMLPHVVVDVVASVTSGRCPEQACRIPGYVV